MTTDLQRRASLNGTTGTCPDCGAVTPLRSGRIDAHYQAIIRGGQVATGGRCGGEGAPPDVDVTGLHPVVADLVRRRMARGWTRRQFAALMGRDRRTLTEMEQGLSSPSLAFLQDAATALGCELAVVPRGAR